MATKQQCLVCHVSETFIMVMMGGIKKTIRSMSSALAMFCFFYECILSVAPKTPRLSCHSLKVLQNVYSPPSLRMTDCHNVKL